ncbi:hypothetical protein BT67DRAFT_443335, partial [Trichocladium antarcticum]
IACCPLLNAMDTKPLFKAKDSRLRDRHRADWFSSLNDMDSGRQLRAYKTKSAV